MVMVEYADMDSEDEGGGETRAWRGRVRAVTDRMDAFELMLRQLDAKLERTFLGRGLVLLSTLKMNPQGFFFVGPLPK